MIRSIVRFSLRHWRGRCSLAVTFWFSFVTLTAAIVGLNQLTEDVLADGSGALFYALLAQFVIFRLLVYPWQVVGAVRACERALKGYGEPFWARSFQLLLALSLVFVFIEALAVVRAGYSARAASAMQELAPEAPLSLTADGHLAVFRGFFSHGATEELRRLLDEHPGVSVLVLNSRGGPVFEARGLARLIRERGLDTYSTSECSSACVTAFVAGKTRRLAPGAQLGLHRYRLAARQHWHRIDADRELRKDLAFFRAQDVDVSLLEKALATPHDRMWYPDRELLLQSRIVHSIAPPP